MQIYRVMEQKNLVCYINNFLNPTDLHQLGKHHWSNKGYFPAICKSPPWSLVPCVTLESRENSDWCQGTSKAFLIYGSFIILRNVMAKAAASWVLLEGQRLQWWATQMIDMRQLLDFTNVHTNNPSRAWQHAAKPFYSPNPWSSPSSHQGLTFTTTTSSA